MALVRKCDLCPKIEGVQHYVVRWDSSTGSADLCPEHGTILTQHLSEETPTRKPSTRTGARRGPALTKVTTIEDIEKQKKAAK